MKAVIRLVSQLILLFTLVSLILFPSGCSQETVERPNVVFFLVDDLGWRDVGCYGSDFYETPNIDQLAIDGMKFSQAYAASPVCSPTRAAIMSGKNPGRLHITDWIGGSQRGKLLPAEYVHQLPLEEITIAEALKEYGYSTGFFGKWHLGDSSFYPQFQGFDINIGGHSAGHPASYFYPYGGKKYHNWDVPDLDGGKEGEYLTDRLTDETLRFIELNKDNPFFAYLSHYAVHTPIMAKESYADSFRIKADALPDLGNGAYSTEHESFSKQRQDNPEYAAMIQSVDESLGRIVDKLKELGLYENTVIIFASDNGGLSTLPRRWAPTSVTPLRAGKGWNYEGGIRVPQIILAPGITSPGSESDIPVVSMDFYPTILDLLAIPQKKNQHIDGQSLVPLLTGNSGFPKRDLHWHFPHYHGSGHKPSEAVLSGKYKLIEFFESGNLELYDLEADPEERNDLSETFPKIRDSLYEKMSAWRSQVDAWLPRTDSL